MHAIKDCIQAREIWVRLLALELLIEFFSKDTTDWIVWVLKTGKAMTRRKRWVKKILMVSSLQWRRRNDEIFGRNRLEIQQKIWNVMSCFEEDDLV